MQRVCAVMLACSHSLKHSHRNMYSSHPGKAVGGNYHSGFARYFRVQRFDVFASTGCKTSALTDRRPDEIQQWHNKLFLLVVRGGKTKILILFFFCSNSSVHTILIQQGIILRYYETKPGWQCVTFCVLGVFDCLTIAVLISECSLSPQKQLYREMCHLIQPVQEP